MSRRFLSRTGPLWVICGFLSGVATSFAAPSSLGSLAVLPRIVPAGSASTVTVTLPRLDSSYISGSAALYTTDASGKPLRKLATFVDDGSKGDRVAGDGILTAQFVVTEAAPSDFPIVASAAFKGALLRVFSHPEVIEVASDADAAGAKAIVEGDAVVFRYPNGSDVRSIPVSASTQTVVETDTIRLTEEAVISNDQSHVGVFSSRQIVPNNSEEVLEYSPLDAEFRMYSGAAGLLWQLEAPDGNHFFLPNNRWLFSRKGDRIALVTAGENDEDAVLAVHTEWGARIYQSLESFALIRDAALSPDGKFLAALVLRRVGATAQFLFWVAKVDTGEVTEYAFDADAFDSYYFLPADTGFRLFLNGAPAVSIP